MATLQKEPLRVGYTISGNSAETSEGIEGASQTYKAGAVLFLSASGVLRSLPTANISRADVSRGIAGVALADANNNTNSTTKIRYLVVNDDTVFQSNISSRFTTATATLARQYRGTVCAGSINSSRFYVSVRMVAATNSICMIRSFIDNPGDQYGRVYFQFLKAARAYR